MYIYNFSIPTILTLFDSDVFYTVDTHGPKKHPYFISNVDVQKWSIIERIQVFFLIW